MHSHILYILNVFGFMSLGLGAVVLGSVSRCVCNNNNNNKTLLDPMYRWYVFFLKILDRAFMGIHVLQAYPEIEGAHILVLNHSASCDVYVLPHVARSFKCVSVVKKALMYIPILGTLFYLLDYIFVDRKDVYSRQKCKDEIAHHVLEKGDVVQIFPEGTRNFGNKKRFSKGEIEFKKGVFEIAAQHNIRIVAVFHTIGSYVDDENMCFHTDYTPYMIASEKIFADPDPEKLRKLVYAEFVEMEKRVEAIEKEERDQDLDSDLDYCFFQPYAFKRR